jgi:chromatin structure-remodeling complex subunit RSC1/2
MFLYDIVGLCSLLSSLLYRCLVLTFSFFYIAKLFDRDPTTNEVLWFAAPPMNMSRARSPKYSLEYLKFITARKRKRREGAGTDGIVVDDDDTTREEGTTTKDEWREEGSAGSAKRPRVGFPPTVTETMRELWKEMRADGYTI